MELGFGIEPDGFEIDSTAGGVVENQEARAAGYPVRSKEKSVATGNERWPLLLSVSSTGQSS